MGTAKNLLSVLKKVDVNDISLKSVEETKEEYVLENQEQMLAGKTSDGSDITPSYLNDPYFKSRESAQRYSDWKDAISPKAGRNSGTPNLFINGRYHNGLRAVVDSEGVRIESSSPDTVGIESKFTRKIYGIQGQFKSDYLSYALRPVWKKKIENATGLKLML